MHREDLLKKLHSIRVGAQPTCFTNDMGLQYEYVTSEGYGEGFGDMGDWPVYAITNITEVQLRSFQKKISDRSLSLDDLVGTDLDRLCKVITDVPRLPGYIFDVCDFLKNLDQITTVIDNTLYVLCDAGQWEPVAYFFETYDELEEAFVDYYVSYIEEWESFTDEELAEWIDRIRNELNSIPFIRFENEEADESD